jgi:hypothetical protein
VQLARLGPAADPQGTRLPHQCTAFPPAQRERRALVRVEGLLEEVRDVKRCERIV